MNALRIAAVWPTAQDLTASDVARLITPVMAHHELRTNASEQLAGPGWHGLAWRAAATESNELVGSTQFSVTSRLNDLRHELRTAAGPRGVDVAVTTGILAANGPRLLISDVDSTLITDEVIELMAAHAGSMAEVATVTEAAMRGELDFAASLQQRVATLAGLPVSALTHVRDSVVLTPGARQLVAGLQQRDCQVGLVSGGFSEIVEPLAAELGIELVAANRLQVRDGQLTGSTDGDVIDRDAKKRYLRQWAATSRVPLAATVAVGDGANDLGMLDAAGLGVAFCATPVVAERAAVTLSFPRLDALLGLLGA